MLNLNIHVHFGFWKLLSALILQDILLETGLQLPARRSQLHVVYTLKKILLNSLKHIRLG